MTHEIVDILVIGGGINGTAIAADAAGRGLNVMLCEKGDLASGTSSWSTKLIHGGLRYLENYEFKMVRAALQEREILIQRAPHLIHPIPFIIPHQKHLRPAWMIQIGLWLYDHLAKRRFTPSSSRIKLNQHHAGVPLKQELKTGFQYYDGQTDDCRLVITNALSAFEHGAAILTQTQCIKASRRESLWEVILQDQLSQQQRIVGAKMVINASGPWANQSLSNIFDLNQTPAITLVKGSHIVVKSLYANPQAYLLQSKDKRIIFTIPYQKDFTLIGTTDIPFTGSPDDVTIEESEKDYLLNHINQYFKKQLTQNDILWDFSGVRPLYQLKEKQASKISREHHIDIDTQQHLPLVNIYGGKLTSHRKLAEEVMQKIQPWFDKMQPAWTASSSLPGGDFTSLPFKNNIAIYQQRYPWLAEPILLHYLIHYGTRIEALLQNCQSPTDLGPHFGSTLYGVEIDYCLAAEWATSSDDILWRRTKYGLHLNPEQIKQVKCYLNETTNPT